MGVIELLLLAVGMVVIWRWRRSRGADETSEVSEYTKKPDGNYEVFAVHPSRAPKYKVFLYAGIFFFIIGGIEVLFAFRALSGYGTDSFSTAFFLLAVGGGLYWIGSTRDFRPQSHRVARTFRVSPAAIEVDGLVFKKEDIHRLIIKNGLRGDGQTWDMVTPHTTGATATRIQQQERNAAVCYSLDLEAGGKGHMLAGGMDTTTVNGLMHDVSGIVGFSKS